MHDRVRNPMWSGFYTYQPSFVHCPQCPCSRVRAPPSVTVSRPKWAAELRRWSTLAASCSIGAGLSSDQSGFQLKGVKPTLSGWFSQGLVLRHLSGRLGFFKFIQESVDLCSRDLVPEE